MRWTEPGRSRDGGAREPRRGRGGAVPWAAVRALRASYGTPGARSPTPFANLGTVDKKNALRAGALAAGTTLMMLLMSSPALALTRDDGDDPGPGLSVGETLGLYVVAPIGLFLLIAGLVWVLDKSKDRGDTTSSNITVKGRAKAKA